MAVDSTTFVILLQPSLYVFESFLDPPQTLLELRR